MRKRKGILVICDGLGDRPNPQLGAKTPLEYARTPNLDYLAKNGICGNVHPIAPGIRVGTDVGHMEIFGCSSDEFYPGRGPLEAFSAGLDIETNDVAFRGNFGTIDDERLVLDRRAGRITKDTDLLASSLNGMLLSDGTRVLVKELTAHRVAIVFKGKNLSVHIQTPDPHSSGNGEKLLEIKALTEEASAIQTAKNLEEFTQKSYEILKEHPVNKQRVQEGLLPANVIITRGVGQKKFIPNKSSEFGIKAICIAGDQTVGGIAKLVGFDYYTCDEFTGGFDTNIMKKAEKAVELLKADYDWVILHMKATDLAGHDNLPLKKVEMIEKVDHIFGYLKEHLNKEEYYISFTADHSTPCACKDHTGDPVPTLIYGDDVRVDSVSQAGETDFNHGGIDQMTAQDIFMVQMDLMGFTKKRGA